MTRIDYLDAYRREIAPRYFDRAALDRHMSIVIRNLNGDYCGNWAASSPASEAACKAIGFKGRPTMRALRNLPMPKLTAEG